MQSKNFAFTVHYILSKRFIKFPYFSLEIINTSEQKFITGEFHQLFARVTDAETCIKPIWFVASCQTFCAEAQTNLRLTCNLLSINCSQFIYPQNTVMCPNQSKPALTISFKISSNILCLCVSWITVSTLLLNTCCPSHPHSQVSKISYLSLIATFNKSIQLHPKLVLASVPSLIFLTSRGRRRGSEKEGWPFCNMDCNH